ncbi:hypothetical protein S245_065527, partial [Arachis hypogaea]
KIEESVNINTWLRQGLFMNGATFYTNESLEPPTMSIKEFASAARKTNNQ